MMADVRSGGRGAGATRTRWSRQVALDVVGLLDATAVVLGAVLPALIYHLGGGLVTKWATVFQTGMVTALIVYWMLRNWGLYDTDRIHDLPVAPGKLLGALALTLLALLGLGVPFATGQAHLWIWYSVWMSASFLLLLTNRTVANHALKSFAKAGRFDTRVAVFGAGTVARRVADHLADPAHRVQFAGMFDDRPADRVNTEGLAITGRLEDLIEAGRRGDIDRVIVALPQAADRRIAGIARKLEQLPCSVHVVTHMAGDLVDQGPAHHVSALGPVGLLDVKPRPLADWSPMLKRAEDIVLGSLLTLVALPVMALIALAIRLESNGPVLFVQRRSGLNRRPFDVLKFRTMSVAENGPEIRQAQQNDPRVTRTGRILRRFSLDELPQLFNVLKGEMSLVGPRPHAIAHDDEWTDVVERYANRHQVKPGLTGLAQIEGWRGESDTTDKVQARVERDLAYISGWTLWLDLKIIAVTGWAVLKGKNAY